MIAFEVWDRPAVDGWPRCGIIMSQRWMAEQWAGREPGRTITEVEVNDPAVLAVFADGREAAWCARVGLVEP